MDHDLLSPSFVGVLSGSPGAGSRLSGASSLQMNAVDDYLMIRRSLLVPCASH